MGYDKGRSKNLIAETQYLGSESDEVKHTAKDKFTLTDKDGNRIYYELQSTQQGTGDKFGGYLITHTNIDPEDQQKFLASAKKYFAEHPEERTTKLNNDAALVGDYQKILIQEAAGDSFRGESGRPATHMEKTYLYQYSYLEQVNKGKDKMQYLSWEQVTGRQDFGDDMVAASRQSIGQDSMNEKWQDAEFGEKWEQSADRGEQSLRDRMKRDAANARQSITMGRNGDGQRTMTVTQATPNTPETFDEDEKNALVRYAIKRQRQEQK